MIKFGKLSLMIVLFCLILTITAAADYSESIHIYDEAELLSAAEIQELEQALKKSSDGDVTYIIGTTRKYYSDRGYLGDDFCNNHGISQTNNIVMLIIDVSDPNETHYDIYTYGEAFNKITDKEINRILYRDDVHDALKSGRFLQGSVAFLKYSSIAYNGHLPMKTGTIILISVLTGTIIASVSSAIVIIKYKTKLKSTSYPIDKYAKLDLREKSDIFIGSNVTRVRVQSSSSSSGSGQSSGGGGHRGGA